MSGNTAVAEGIRANNRQLMRDVIVRVMSDYGPILSKTMISSHVNTSSLNYDVDWKDVFDDLIREGTIVEMRLELKGRMATAYRLARRP